MWCCVRECRVNSECVYFARKGTKMGFEDHKRDINSTKWHYYSVAFMLVCDCLTTMIPKMTTTTTTMTMATQNGFCRWCVLDSFFSRCALHLENNGKLHSFNGSFTTHMLSYCRKAGHSVLLVFCLALLSSIFFFVSASISHYSCVFGLVAATLALYSFFCRFSYTQHNIHNGPCIVSNEWYFNSSEININVISMLRFSYAYLCLLTLLLLMNMTNKLAEKIAMPFFQSTT